MTKKQRQAVYEKYGGRCAYTGKPLDEKWQVDHKEPKCNYRGGLQGNPDCITNLLPAIRIINHYKRGKDLELFRSSIQKLHVTLNKLPIKTQREKTINRKNYLLKVAELFDVSVDKPFSGVFYFESVEGTAQSHGRKQS